MMLRSITCAAVIGILMVVPVVHAEPVIVEPGWTLIRMINFVNPQAAHYNPADGLLYVGRRGTSSDGLYRIDSRGFAVKLATGSNTAAVVVDPVDGDIFVSEDYGGRIFRTAFGATGRETWVYGLHSGDDDPIGMAVAPANYVGSVVAAGEALVIDRGNSGPDEVWAWSPDTAEGEWVIHADNGTLVDATDITIGVSDVYLVDHGSSVIYTLADDGTLTPLATSQPIGSPVGITVDPASDDLYVLDAGTGDRVVRVDPGTGTVTDVFTGFGDLSLVSWAGIDASPEGRRIIVTDTAQDAVFVFARCDATGFPEMDCDGNTVWDVCDIQLGMSLDCNGNQVPDECDLTSGTSDDCNEDGLPDECPDCPPLDVVFVMDTSTSMNDEAGALCQSLDAIVAQLVATGLDVTPTLLGIANNPGGAYGCLTDNVINLLGTAVPGSPPPGLEQLGSCPGGNEVAHEDWGLATAVVAGGFPWATDAMRLIVPISDEGPWCGNPVTQMDADSIGHAIVVAQEENVIVSPITGTGSSGSVIALAQQIADATGGTQSSSSAPDQDIAEAIANLVLDACSLVSDCNENDVLDDCETIGPADYNADSHTNLEDFPGFVSCMGGPGVTPVHPVSECVQVCMDAFDLNADVDVDLADFSAFQQALAGGNE
ncbi:MAG: NHL repeat-containing protein [Planctomycetota bacterium]|jgi:DNA-binding beta-propeller fold protein YncE